MASIYDIDFYSFGVQMLPPNKRNNNIISFISVLLSPIQWLRDLWFSEYTTGTTASPFNNSAPYQKYSRVLFNKSVYESLIDNNTDIPTTSNWFMVQKNFIGLSERILYNGNSLVLTYALNKWFGTTFNQPPIQSDIYISNNTIANPVFIIGQNESDSSKVSSTGSTEFIGINETITAQINFTIHVPTAIYNGLDVTGINNEKIFRNFVDNYVPAGILYSIQTY